ncbi:MAG TPA: hypothetical protein VFY48_08530 [Solirubrobacterales bacterium]|nr:hypothetical protein [Solirubrobacterales bacterium]
MIEIFLLVVGTAIGTVLAMEAWASAPHVGAWLVRGTIGGFPDAVPRGDRVRWAEEIEGDFATFRDRRLAGLVFALRLRIKGGRKLAAELALAQLSAAETTAGVPSQAESAGARSGRQAIERSLAELSIADLAAVARREAGKSLEELAEPRPNQHHREWREAVQRSLARDMDRRRPAGERGGEGR